MPTRQNQTTITISDELKRELEKYDKESWDDLFSRVLILMEKEADD